MSPTIVIGLLVIIVTNAALLINYLSQIDCFRFDDSSVMHEVSLSWFDSVIDLTHNT